jgi:uncharacterized protein involved in high-affinity Fe2+ transport
MRVSEEAKENHILLAKKQGQAFKVALDEMTQNVAQTGMEKKAGHYMVGYAVERPEGMYHVRQGELHWQEPEDENIHIEISVRDGADGRFIPALDVKLTVLKADGEMVGTHQQPFLWHPWLYHYGRNWKLPGSGKYTFKINIDMPKFHRHDKENGCRFTEPVEVVFEDIDIQTNHR